MNPKPPIEVEKILKELLTNTGGEFGYGRFLKEALDALNRAYGEQMLGMVGEDEPLVPFEFESYPEVTAGNMARAKLRAAIHKQFLEGQK